MTDDHDSSADPSLAGHPMLAKVRKLLAKAEDPAATAAESEAYTGLAARLMADYGIDQALLAVRDPGVDPVEDLRIPVSAPYAREKVALLATIARSCACSAVEVRGRDATVVHLFGHRSDLTRAEVLFTSLLMQSTRQLLHTPIPWGEHKAAFRRTWLLGFASAVGRRLAEEQRAAETGAEPLFAAAGSTAALVRVRREGEVEDAVQKSYPTLRSAAPRMLTGNGASAGYAFGQRADLGIGDRVASGRAGRELPG